jgi:hypothetical protein
MAKPTLRTAIATLGVALLIITGASGHVLGTPPATDDCQVSVIAEEGTPPPGTPRLDPQKLCDALKRAEQEAGQR